MLGWTRGRRTIASIAALAVVAGVPITFAIIHDGFPVSDVSLNVKDVWVTNDDRQMGGRLNRQIDELTASAQAESSSLDVVQDGAQVFLRDTTANTIQRIERSRTTLVQKTLVPEDAEISLGKTTMSIVDPANGDLWVVNVANGLNFDEKSTKPDVKLGAGGHAVVDHSGAVFAVSPKSSKLYQLPGAGALPTSTPLKVPASSQLSVVGDKPVLLAGKTLITGDGKRTTLPGDPLQLQLPGDTNSFALVATGTGLVEAPLDGGKPTVIQANIAPQTSTSEVSAPVWLQGCDYGAWSAQQMYVQRCGQNPPSRVTIDVQIGSDPLKFRVNKNVIALNDLQNGNSWVLSSKVKIVKNWDEVSPPKQSKTTKGHLKSTEESFEDTLAKRTAINHPPVANDDTFGVRPGRTTILPVLDNDSDQDGDVLIVDPLPVLPKSDGHLDLIDGGRALQYTPTSSPPASFNFSYTASDGRGGTDEANVDMRVVAENTNTKPKSNRQATVSVESGQQVQYNVLSDWRDPDGDDLQLKSASPTSADDVSFTPDGFITFKHKSGDLGNKTVNFVVTDGTFDVPGHLTVDVKAAGSLQPVGTPDFAQTFVGKPTVIKPLVNDVSPSGKAKKLVSFKGAPASATVTMNPDAQTITVSSTTPGAIYLTYDLQTGTEHGEGIIRVDVMKDPANDLPPIAVKDVGYLRSGQPTSVKVLDNDVSPEGRVLSVQSVDLDHTDPAVKVELLNNTYVRISSSGGLTKQTQFTYTISDGDHTSVAGVTVVPVAPVVNRQPPVAQDDDVKVRAGDIASVDVLKNDDSPQQDQLSVNPLLTDTSHDGGGLAFVNGTTVRYQAPTKAGQYYVVYRAQDQYGESSTARVNFTVTPIDQATNQAPAPNPQTARAFAGQTITINVPLDGIDPDGDSSFLRGVVTPPVYGSVSQASPTSFTYKANVDAAGTDSFTYKVVDTFGKIGQGVINVGIIPRGDLTAQPNAVNDNVDVRPGKQVSVQVLVNDSDPNGFPLSLSKKLTDVSPVLSAHVTGRKVIITAPKKEGLYSLTYAISNGQGGTDTAFVNVRVTHLAKLVPPTAIDDYIPDSKIHGNKAITVDVESLIDNPNGEDSDLLITAEGPNAERANISQVKGTISVVPQESRYAVAYRVTDPTDKALSATAFIVVPPAADSKQVGEPELKTNLPLQVVKMNTSREWKLSDILDVPSGREATLTGAANIKATHTDASSPYVDKGTIRFTPAKDYRGPASMTFEVTDDPSDSSRKTYVVMPITVGDPDQTDVPPTFTRLTKQIQAGEKPLVIDLRDSTAHPNRSLISQFTYSGLGGQTPKIAATLSGSRLSISAPLGVQPGATAKLHFVIKYKSFTVPGEVDVVTVKSTRALTQAPLQMSDVVRGHSVSLDVLAHDLNPYADQNKPLTIIDANIVNSAAGHVDIAPHSGLTLSQQDVGIIDVIYTIRDASGDPSRDVKGEWQVTSRDVPDQPSPPTIVDQADKQVTVGWQPPATNGATILSYTIITSGGIPSQTVSANDSQATITGLTNGNNYTFQVLAHNMIGDSTPSAPSATAIPFGKPGAPGTGSLTASSNGAGTLSLAWGAANGNGRSVSSYTWTLSDGQHGTVNALSTSVTGKVGTSYTFTVVATNPAGDGSPSGASNSATPRPGAPSSATATAGAVGDTTVTLSWGAAPSNVAITRYEISVNGGGWQNEGTARSTTTTGSFGSGTSFQVRAVSGGQTSDATGSNTAVPTAPPAASATIVGKGPNSTCSDGGSGCKAAIVELDNIISGTYTVSIQELNSAGTVVFNGSAKKCAASSGQRCTSGGILGLLPQGDTMRVHIYNGPSPDFYSNSLDRAGWQAFG